MSHDVLDACGDLLRNSRHPLVFTGAGMSAESGLPTFRDSDNSLWPRWPPETLASAGGFRDEKALVWGWYAWRMANIAKSTPNAGHLAPVSYTHLDVYKRQSPPRHQQHRRLPPSQT